MSSGHGIRGWCDGPSGTSSLRVPGRLLLVLALVLLAGGVAFAGSISLTWDPVDDPDVTGYRVYYGLAPTAMTAVTDAGPVTEKTIEGLADCATWYLSVRSYDGGGLESAESSNLVMGWPRPVVAASQPRSILPGETALLTVTGVNFDPGVPGDARHPGATIELSHPGLRVLEVFHDACGQVRVRVEALADAQPGWSALTVRNVDVSWDDPSIHPQVFGTMERGLEVRSLQTNDAPAVAGSTPVPGAVNVATSVKPSILFSEAVDPASVTTLSVRLLDSTGAAVAQASGSPSVSGAEVTIFPAQTLRASTSYRIEVTGGAGGVKDLTGLPLEATWRLDPAFTTAADTTPAGATVVESAPSAGETGVSVASREVRVTFDRDMRSLASVANAATLQKSFRVLYGTKTLAHASGSPAFENEGRTVVIRLREPLQAGLTYTTSVNLTDAKLRKALTDAGHADLAMSRPWTTSPAWKTVEALVAAEARIAGSESGVPLFIGGAGPSPQNAAVSVNSEFRLTFAEPVSSATVTPSTIRILSGDKALGLAERPQFEAGGRTVVIRAAGALAPGKLHKIQVRTGRKGVMLQVAGGGAAPIGAPRIIYVHFATEVSPATQSQSLGMGE
jgi:hypothetical protein